MTEKTLIPIEQKLVTFNDDELIAVRADDGGIYVAIRQMCLALQLDPQAQRRRMTRHTVLERGLKVVAKLATTTGERDAYVLRVGLVPFWLAGIRTSAISDDTIREKLETYQEKAADVLWQAFKEGRLTSDPVRAEIMVSDSPSAVAYRLAEEAEQQVQAIKSMALQQYKHEQHLLDHDHRLETIEALLANPDRLITNAQAERISQAVKAVALELGRRSGKNEHGGVYGEVYRTYSITSYKELPASKFTDCIGMLTEWYNSLVDNVVF